MPIHKIMVPRLAVMALRVVELISAAVVAAIVGYYLYPLSQSNTWPAKRYIFTEAWAGISIILSVVWLVPKLAYRVPWLADFTVSVGWWTSFGLLLKAIDCGEFFSLQVRDGVSCRNWRSVQVFCFLSAIAWIVTGLMGIQFVQQRRRGSRGGRRNMFY